MVALFAGILGAAVELALSSSLALALTLTFDAPTDWTPVPAASSMRLAEWRVASRSEVVVFYFGPGQGGSVDANVDRWIGQFQQPDGVPTRERARTSEKKVGALKVTLVDVTGTYVAPTRPGGAELRNEPDTRMIAAVVEGSGGPWFIRFLGPREEVGAKEPGFDDFLSTLRVQ
jgi:hypothetical protein